MEPHPWCQLTASALTGSLSRGRLTQATVSGERTSLSGIWLCGFPAHHAPAGQQTTLFLHLQLVPLPGEGATLSSNCPYPDQKQKSFLLLIMSVARAQTSCPSCPLSLRGWPFGVQGLVLVPGLWVNEPDKHLWDSHALAPMDHFISGCDQHCSPVSTGLGSLRRGIFSAWHWGW